MAEMGIIHREITQDDLVPKFQFTLKEKDLEQGLIDNIGDISAACMWGDVKRVERQFRLAGFKKRVVCDLMIWHTDGTGTIIEVKTGSNNRNSDLSAIGQLMFYASIAEKTLGALPRMVIAAPEIDVETYNAARRFKVPISFLMVDNDRCIYLGCDR